MKFIFTLLCLVISLNAITNHTLILKKYLSKDDASYKKLSTYNLKKELFKKASLKIVLNKKLLANNLFYLKIFNDTKHIKSSNMKYELYFDYMIFKLDKNSPKNLEVTFEFPKQQTIKLSFFRLNEFEYKYIFKKEAMLYGIAYGIIFCAFLYNLIIFLYSFQKAFLYYSLMQLCLMIILYYIVILNNQAYVTYVQQSIIDFFETTCILMMILFSKEILNTKKHTPLINFTLNIFIIFSFIDVIFIFILKHSFMYLYVARSWIIALLLISGLLTISKGQKVAIFYVLGWLVILLSLIISENDFGGFNDIYVIHVGLPLESLILSFALGYKLKQTVDEKKQRDKILIQQSKLAAMGEMLNNISHQWKQPLANLSFINMDLKMAIKSNDINELYLTEIVDDSTKQINFMTETIDNFKGFYQPSRSKEEFMASEIIHDAVSIMKPTVDLANIYLKISINSDTKIKSYKNEYIQVILNLISNSKDAIVERNIQEAFIQITLDKNINNKFEINISDNAQGIEESIIHKIFDPYFTTKKQNSGIGLYMSKIIIEAHLKAHISVKNTKVGVCFTVEL